MVVMQVGCALHNHQLPMLRYANKVFKQAGCVIV